MSWAPGRPFLLVGLTGGIATGKSTVSATFQALGCALIDADVLAREVVAPGEPAFGEIVREFGPGVLGPDGALDRKALGAIVFADAARRRRLEAITHPRVHERLARRLAELTEVGFAGIVIFDVALIVESGNYRTMDRLVVVVADEEAQIQRLTSRDGISRDAALGKIRSQMPLSEKVKVAHYVIDNSGDRGATEAQVRRVHAALNGELSVARDVLAAAGGEVVRPTLGVLFPRNMGHYGQNRGSPDEAFRALRHQASGVRFVAYHPRPSGNFIFHDSDEQSSRAAAEACQRVFGLKPVVRLFPQLIALDWSAPSSARSTPQGSVEVDTPGGPKELVVVLLSEDVGVQQRITGPISRRVEVLSWPSAREALCLYERPQDGGSYGQVAEAVGRTIVALGGAATLYGTGRGFGVVRDVLNGVLRVDGLRELNARHDRIDLRGPVDHL